MPAGDRKQVTHIGSPDPSSLPDLQVIITGNTTLPNATRVLNPPAQSVGSGPIGFGEASAVAGLMAWETIMPGGYNTFSCEVPIDEVVNFPNAYVQQADVKVVLAQAALGMNVGDVLWQGYLNEPVRNPTGSIELQCNGYWQLLQEKEDPLFWQSGDGDDWADAEEDPFKPGGTEFKNSDGIDVNVRKSSLKFKVPSGTGLKGAGSGKGPLDVPTDHAAAGIDVTKQHKIVRLSFRRLQNRDNPNGHILRLGFWKADRPDQNKNQWKKVDTVSINDKVNIAAGDYYEKKIDKLATETDDAHVLLINLWANKDSPSGGLNNDFVIKLRDLHVNGDAYRDLSFPVNHPQWGGDVVGNYGQEYRVVSPTTGEEGGYTGNEMIRDIAYHWLGDTGDVTSLPGGGDGNVNSKIPVGAYYGPGPYAGDGSGGAGDNQRRHEAERPYGRISDILRDGTSTFDLLPEWWNDGSWWDFLDHIATKYGNKVAFWGLQDGFEFSSWRHKYAPWTKTWQVACFGSQAFTNCDLQPAEEVYSGVSVRYKTKGSRRVRFVRKDINPNPFAGLPGPQRERIFKYRVKERRRNDNLANDIASVLADHLSGIRLSGTIGPMSFVYDEFDEGKKTTALKPRAGDKVRITDFPGGILDSDIDSTQTTITVQETGGTGAAGPHGRVGTNIVQHAEFNIAIEDDGTGTNREIMHVTKRTVDLTSGVVTYEVVRNWDPDEETGGVGTAHAANDTMLYWFNLRIMGTNGTLDEGVYFDCSYRPIKIERYLWHARRQHDKEHSHDR